MKRLSTYIHLTVNILTMLFIIQACSYYLNDHHSRHERKRNPSSQECLDTSQDREKLSNLKIFKLPQIEGSPEFRQRIKSALSILQNNSNKLYINSISKYVTKIKEGERSGAHVYGASPWVELNISSCPADNMEWCASVLYHESVHTYLYRNGKPHTGEKAELFCNLRQLDALKEMNASDSTIDWLKNIISNGDHSDLDGDGDYDWDDYNLRQW